MATTDAVLARMRANAEVALSQGARPLDVVAHLLAVLRPGVSRPGDREQADATDVLELVETLNGFRAVPPGEVAP